MVMKNKNILTKEEEEKIFKDIKYIINNGGALMALSEDQKVRFFLNHNSQLSTAFALVETCREIIVDHTIAHALGNGKDVKKEVEKLAGAKNKIEVCPPNHESKKEKNSKTMFANNSKRKALMKKRSGHTARETAQKKNRIYGQT